MFAAFILLLRALEQPAVSVVMCAYNAELTVAASAYSVVTQKHVDFELVFVDDGSTDGTAQQIGAVIKQSAVPVQLVQSKENLGLVQARRKGVEAARGALIVFVDADDFLMEGALENLVRQARGSAADLLHFVAILQGGGVTNTAHWWNPSEEFSSSGVSALGRLLQFKSGHSVWAKVFKRALLLKAYGVLEKYAPDALRAHVVYAEDFLLTAVYYLLIEKYQASTFRGYIYMDMAQNSVQSWRQDQTKSFKRLRDTFSVVQALESVFRSVARLQYPQAHDSFQQVMSVAVLQHMSFFVCTKEEKLLFQKADELGLLQSFPASLYRVCDDPEKLSDAARVLGQDIRQ